MYFSWNIIIVILLSTQLYKLLQLHNATKDIKKVRHLFNHKNNQLFLNTKTIYKKGLYANFISSIDAPDAEACIKARDNLKSAINGAISSRLNFWSSSSSRRRKRTSTKCSSTSMLDICPDFSMNCALKAKN